MFLNIHRKTPVLLCRSLFSRCSYLYETKACIGQANIVYKQRHLYHLLKTPNYIALFISPDNYDIAVNRKENANVLMFLMFQWLWLLTIVKFIITQPFAKHRFLKKISAWLLLTSKFFSQFNSMFCYHNFRMLQKGLSQVLFAWSVKWWVSLKLWNNHPRDWINNFPIFSYSM